MRKNKKRKNNQNNIKKVIIVLILIVIVTLITKIVTTKKLKVEFQNDMQLTLKYSSFEYKLEKNAEGKILKGKNAQIIIKELEAMSNHGSDYNLLKDYKKAAYKGEAVNYNGKEYLLYKKKDGEYKLLTQIDNNYYLEIQIIIENTTNAEKLVEIINNNKLNKILETIKID